MIHVDHYMCKPVAPFDDLKSEVSGRPNAKVPIIRIFGTDAIGRKICLHVHGFYPYIAIQTREPDNAGLARRIVQDIERSLADSIEENNKRKRKDTPGSTRDQHQAAVAAGQQQQTDVLGQDSDSNLMARLHQERPQMMFLSSDQKSPVYKIEPVSSFNYYGYHNKPEAFFKIYLNNPRMVKPLAQLFEDCKVLGRFVPVFWAHLPYILLFFIDNNLRGMEFIEVEQPYWRRDKAPCDSSTSPFSPQPATSATPSQEDAANFTTDLEPISSCELEADIRYEWILNKLRFGSNGNDDALRELWLDDQEASQRTSLIDPKLPLYNLEREYIRQLCECYQVNYDNLNLMLDEPPSQSQMIPIEPDYADSDGSLEIYLKDREDVPMEQFEENIEEIKQANLTFNDWPVEDEEFSDDDEFIRNINIEAKKEPCEVKIKTAGSLSGPDVKQTVPMYVKVKQEDNSDERQLVLAATSEDEFSDDEQFLEAVIRAETQDPTLRSQSSKTRTPQANTRRKFSDNSMIDGRSVVCSTPTRSKAGSQHSTSSNTREHVSHEYQFICQLSMEVHVTTRDQLRPDPAFDPIEAVFYCVRNDAPDSTRGKPSQTVGMIITDPFRDENLQAGSSESIMSPSSRANMSFVQKMRTLLHKTGLSTRDLDLHIVDTEQELILSLVQIVSSHDPEILIGYEMEQLSWGFVLERASILNINLGPQLSRIQDSSVGHNSKVVEPNFVQPIMFTGRMVFSTWRIIKHEINLNTCSYERIHHHALGERVPCFSFRTLSKWFNQHRNRWRVIDYYLIRVVGQMRILDRFDLIAKVSELARVYGTQLIDVITRGSQIGIESMMLRLAKLQNLSPLSPTVMQRNKMKAPEALPLVMEPETNIYYDPVAVLDFQSLYPSVVIAYNYCYSTCLGRVTDLESKSRHTFGCSQLHVNEEEIQRLLASNSVHVSPCGVAYVKKNIRHGVLPKMLSELIITRAMVKDQMKKNMRSEQPNMRLQRILDHRQHGLKMMANTTYGYTGASYTGRMPCVEIADSIVSKGRETLENAIELVESKTDWGAKVIYGDTDSIFIQFQNCDKDTAFKRAYEMVDAITRANPYPIKMKFEKIYQPCVLQTKKRYCGFKFESPEQTRPEFEAKGIETVRRDCCPAAARMLEMALRIQFTTRDVNEVKRYVQHQFIKIMSGKLSNIQDFIFARQYKPRDLDKSESVFVPAWQIAKRFLATDPRSEPRLNERVPFVIVYGQPKTPLVNLAKTPIEVLENLSYRVNADYYIQKIICPTLNRVFCTMKVDTLLWYKSMPHQNIIHRSHYLVAQKNQKSGAKRLPQSTMSQYFSPSHCPVCAKSIPMSDDICDDCRDNLQASVVRLTEEISKCQRKLFAHHQICRACSSLERCSSEADDDLRYKTTGAEDEDVEVNEHYNPCISYDCPNLFRFHQARLDAMNSNFLSQVLKQIN